MRRGTTSWRTLARRTAAWAGGLAAFASEVGAPHSDRWSMKEAGRVLDALAAPEGTLHYRAPYRGLRGLLRLPRQDKRLVASAEGELWPLPD